MVSYNDKHNQANGEENRDGDDNNYSCNYGVEGPTRRKGIETVRLRQIKNMLASLMLSQGVPMLLSGDECRRTQRGNNNAYCQDNAISWFNWRLTEKHEDLRRFCQALIAFRKAEATVRQSDFLDGQPVRPGGLPDASWYNAAGEPVDWGRNESSLIYLLGAAPQQDALEPPHHHVLITFHAGSQPRQFTFPPIARPLAWRQFVNTAAESPADIFPDLDGPAPPPEGAIQVEARSLLCYVARDEV